MNANDRIALQIGHLVIANTNLAAESDALQEASKVQQAETVTRYQLLEQIIRSDQIPHDQVQKLLDADPKFAAWRKARP